MKYKLLDMIDSLPGGVKWNLHEIHLTGDIKDKDGEADGNPGTLVARPS